MRSTFALLVTAIFVGVVVASSAAKGDGRQTVTVPLVTSHAFPGGDVSLPLLPHRAALRDGIAGGVASIHGKEAVKRGTDDSVVVLMGDVWPTGGFFGTFDVGTPPQPQLVQVDTGSSDLLVAEVGCDGCPAGTVQYAPLLSKTVKNVSCTDPDFNCKTCVDSHCYFNNTYETCDFSDPTAPCSLLGYVYTDDFSINGAAVEVGFGGIAAHAGAPDTEWTNMPGVIGFARLGSADVWKASTVFDALVAAEVFDNVFSMCISNANRSTGAHTGAIVLGGVDSEYLNGTINYTPMATGSDVANDGATPFGWYYLLMTSIQVDGRDLGMNPEYYINTGTILDSGTNTLVLDVAAYSIMAGYFELICEETHLVGICDLLFQESLFGGVCFNMTAADIDAFPEVTIVLPVANSTYEFMELSISGADYLLEHPEKAGAYCLGIQPAVGFFVIGNVMQIPYTIVYDLEKTAIGFADAAGGCGGA